MFDGAQKGVRGALTPSHCSPCTRAPEQADLSHVIHSNAQIRTDSYRASGALVGRSGFWELLFPPSQTLRGDRCGVEKPICLLMLFCPPPSLLDTTRGLFFNHLEWTKISLVKETVSRPRMCDYGNLSISDMFVICVGPVVGLI